MSAPRRVPLPEGLDGLRVDVALSRLFGLSRTSAVELVDSRRRPGRRPGPGEVRPGAPPGPGWRSRCRSRHGRTGGAGAGAGLRVVYDDEDLVVVDKPVGVAAHPSPGWTGPTVTGGLSAAGYRLSTSGAAERQGVVHRLDVGTTGLMVVDAAFAASAHGQEQLVANLEDCLRAAAHGFRSVLIADLGALDLFREARDAGVLPRDMQAKVSVMLPAANAAAARVLERLGASTINLPTDLTLAQIAAVRAAVDVPLDVYVEAPDNLGGFVRLHEIPELIRVAAPVYVKFGLRNAPDVYPAGTHLAATTAALSRERVRRARLGLELLERSGYRPVTSELGAAGLAVPEPIDKTKES